MRGSRRFAWLLGALAVATASAQDIPLEARKYVVAEFRLHSGATIRNMVVEYATLGEPRRDAAGDIVNAVINLHGASGDYRHTVTRAKDLVGPGRPLDPSRYFIIFPSALGSPGSSSPSSSGLGADFPQYTVADQVTAQYRLVTEHLGIKHLAGVIGISMGGFNTLQWITQYPDMMDWAVPIAASARAEGRVLGVFGLINHTIRADPGYRDGRYTEPPRQGLRRALMGLQLWLFGDAFYQRYRTEAEMMQSLEEAGLQGDRMDANDFVWRNNAMFRFDVSGKLAAVKARVLLVAVEEDELFPVKETIEPTARAIPGAQLLVFSSALGHVGSGVDVAKANPTILAFLRAAEKH